MSWNLARNSLPLGAFSQEEVTEGLASGRFWNTDLAWREGMAAWEPLWQVLGLTPPAAAVPPALPAFSPELSSSPPPPPLPAEKKLGDDAGMRLLLPVGRSGWAIAAGYLGLFCLAVLPAPVALIVSLIAIRDIRKSRLTDNPKYGLGRAVFGLLMGIFGTGIIAWVFIMMLLKR